MFHFKYKTIATVTMQHAFYRNGISPDFYFEPVLETKELLEAYHLIVRNEDGRLLFLQQLDEASVPFQIIDEAIDLYFMVNLKTSIDTITAAIELDADTSKYYFLSNLNVADESDTYKSVLTTNTRLSAADRFIIPEVAVANDEAQHLSEPSIRKQLFQQLQTARNAWGILHLQFLQNEIALNYTVVLPHKKSRWYYLLQEPKDSDFSTTSFHFDYSKEDNSSRYPDSLSFQTTTIDALDEQVRASLAAKKTTLERLEHIQKVYIYQSASELFLFEDTPPSILLKANSKIVDQQMPIPLRSQTETVINYRLQKS